jgi:outer membrane lipoprotein-sorting protein
MCRAVRCRLSAVSLFLIVGVAIAAEPAVEEVRGWLERVDATRNAFEEAVISARASEIEDGKVTGSADFDIYVKGRDRGVVVFRGGKNDGRKILTSGARMWLIVPGARNPVPITPNQRLMGGASVGDVARLRFSEDFTATLRPESERIGSKDCHVLDLTAKSPRAPYPRIVLWVDAAEILPARVLFSLASGKEAKDVSFTKFSRASGRTVVSEMEIRDLLKPEPGAFTRLEYLNYKRARIDDSIFTPEGARGL